MTEQEDDPHWFTPELREAAIGAANALRVMLSLRRTMPLQYVMTFLQIAQEEGLTVTALATRLELPTSTVSKHLLDLGRINRSKRPGFGLVRTAQLAHRDQREHRVFLTDRGAAVARLMVAALGRRSSLLKMPPSPWYPDGRSRRSTKGDHRA
ncbi:DNA-binding MarR family transcriptional regulator [Bradyrhizobium sp. LM2.7]